MYEELLTFHDNAEDSQVDFELQALKDHLKLAINLLGVFIGFFKVFLKNSFPIKTFGKYQNDLQS